MTDEPSETFLKLKDFRILYDDESGDMALILEADDGQSFRCRFEPKIACDLVAKILYTARNRMQRSGVSPASKAVSTLMPLPVDHLSAELGQGEHVVTLALDVGQIRLAVPLDRRAVEGLREFLALYFPSESPAASRPQ